MRRIRPFYFVRRAAANLRGAPLPAAVTSATIAIAVVLFGVFLLTAENAYRALIGWAGEGDALIVYAKLGSTQAATEALAHRIRALPEVARAEVTSAEQGMSDLRRALGDDADVLEGVDPREVLPTAISVRLQESSLDRDAVGALSARLRHFEGVSSVDSELAWLERFATLGRVLLWGGIGWGAILGFGALLVIGNSTRLAALTRKEEIEVLRLVGASESFIIVPFFLEGAIQGLAGALLGVGVLAGAFFGLQRMLGSDPFLTPFLGGLQFLDPRSVGALAVAGPLLGAVGSVGSARRFLRGIEL